MALKQLHYTDEMALNNKFLLKLMTVTRKITDAIIAKYQQDMAHSSRCETATF